MNEAERKNIVADVLDALASALEKRHWEHTPKDLRDLSAKIRAPKEPEAPPAPEPEIPFGPGDVFETKGNAAGTQWIAVCWDGDDLCGREIDYKPGLYALNLDQLVRVRVAEINDGDAVEVVEQGVICLVKHYDSISQKYLVVDRGGIVASFSRHEIRKLKA